MKRCSECGVAKPEEKFHQGSPRCKRCQHRVPQRVERMRLEAMEPMLGDPLPSDIARATAEIRQTWTPARRQRRRRRAVTLDK